MNSILLLFAMVVLGLGAVLFIIGMLRKPAPTDDGTGGYDPETVYSEMFQGRCDNCGRAYRNCYCGG